MPELPEVETVKNVLSPYLVGQTITQVEFTLPKLVQNCSLDQMTAALINQTMTNVTRRGKYLTVHLGNDARLIIHLRMTGCLNLVPPTTPCLPHTHAILTLSSGQQLRFDDSRGFGRWWYVAPGAADPSGQTRLGPEPGDVTAAYLQQTLGHRHVALKTLLLDQHLVAGIGNIYSDEICFTAGILPMRPAASLTPAEWTRLSAAIPDQIHYFIQQHHVDLATYQQSGGKSYETNRYFRVYGHAGQPCCRCHQPLVGDRLHGRSTVYCPRCQQ